MIPILFLVDDAPSLTVAHQSQRASYLTTKERNSWLSLLVCDTLYNSLPEKSSSSKSEMPNCILLLVLCASGSFDPPPDQLRYSGFSFFPSLSFHLLSLIYLIPIHWVVTEPKLFSCEHGETEHCELMIKLFCQSHWSVQCQRDTLASTIKC